MKPVSERFDEKQCILGLKAGETVEIRSLNEIVFTLDDNCELDGLPFMPEMSKYCGKRLNVLSRVERMIVEGIGVRFIKNVVILEGTICSGERHEGCKRACFFFWKEAWLSRPKRKVSLDILNAEESPVSSLTLFENSDCQSASLASASSDLPIWDLRRFLIMIRQRRFRALFMSMKLEVPPFFTGHRRPSMSTSSRKTPTAALRLQQGETIEVKSKNEIIATLDNAGRNKGLEFTREMEKYCGRKMQVLRRVDRMIIEKTGKMRKITNTVLLEGANCDGQSHGGCPRHCYCLFREIWLRRAEASVENQQITK